MEFLLFVFGVFTFGVAWRARNEARQARQIAIELQRELNALRHGAQQSQAPATRAAAAPSSASPTTSKMSTAHSTSPVASTEPATASATKAAGVTATAASIEGVGATAATQAARAAPPKIPPRRPQPVADTPQWLLAAKAWLFGGNLVAKLGLLILFIGVSFLLRYTAARVAVPIEFRLAGIVLADLALLAWGWRIRSTRPAISLPVQGAALAVLMLVTFGAFRIYHLIPSSLAFGLLLVLTVFTCLLAMLQDAMWLAIFGIVGGFAAPILASSGSGSHIALFTYYALLNAGVFTLALLRAWRPLNVLGFTFTFTIATAWGVLRYAPENYLSVQLFLLLFFAFYVTIPLAYARRQVVQLKNYVDGTLIFGTPMLGFGLQFTLVRDIPFAVAYSALALGLLYITLAVALRKRQQYALLSDAYLALAVVFGTLAIPFALDGRWTSAAWALEGAGIVWMGLRQQRKLAWTFGLLVQVGAWVSFFIGTGDHWFGNASSVFERPLLGALMIVAAALFSSWALKQQQPERGSLAYVAYRLMLVCTALWWFGIAASDLALWLASQEIAWTSCTYAALLAATAVISVIGARTLNWPGLRWFASTVWVALVLISPPLLIALYVEPLPNTPIWLAYAALWFSSEWLLRAWPAQGWTLSGFVLRLLHAIRTFGPWLMIWPVAGHWITHWLSGNAADDWSTSASWSRFIPSWLMMAVIAWLMQRSRSDVWPTAPLAAWYQRYLLPLACGWATLLVAAWNLTQDGAMLPLPYLPLLNPLDLSTCFVVLLLIAMQRLQPRMPPLWFIGLFGYCWFNLALLRTVSHYLSVPYAFDDLFASQFVQAMLSLVWSVTALLLMRYAARHTLRRLWIVGACLLALVVAKLFLVDLSNIGGVERIVSFLGVGALMVGIGYLAPYPSQTEHA
ncbi:DUF2339 domain-containing protein [Pseudoduganella sp. FT55W]|uniref:DUF2339 domain-containing protein n=1 Tax=Duganella rivi TaxID=2666083 RepID=A0A7X4KEJ3_9BURK|nr:DUF2339 domain-containing protein [Duganella rivi]MYM70102.1 DUF2339 domain-containing protein [Duganella rivi]